MARKNPNSRHFLTYRHSLRSYASILYLRLPPGFRIILRGEDVEHHNIVNDMMLQQELTYRPQSSADGIPKAPNMTAVVTIGFVKDAKNRIDIQGFNVYHKNRLIKPFWRVWNAAGSDGRGAIGVLEADFIEPAHDKQGFERTTGLSRLEARLLAMQKQYWYTNCCIIGYAARRKVKLVNDSTRETSPDYLPNSSSGHSKKSSSLDMDKCHSGSNKKQRRYHQRSSKTREFPGYSGNRANTTSKFRKVSSFLTSPAEDDVEYDAQFILPENKLNGSGQKASVAQNSFQKNGSRVNQFSTYSENNIVEQDSASNGRTDRIATFSHPKVANVSSNGNRHASSDRGAHEINQLEQENRDLKERLEKLEQESSHNLLRVLQLEREKCKLLECQLQEAEQKMEDMNKEQAALVDIFTDERNRRANDEENLRKKIKDASNAIQGLLERVRLLERINLPTTSNSAR